MELNRRDWRHSQFGPRVRFVDSATLVLSELTYRPRQYSRVAKTPPSTYKFTFTSQPETIRFYSETFETSGSVPTSVVVNHLFRAKTLESEPTQSFLHDSVLTRCLAQAHREVRDVTLRNAYAELELTEPKLTEPYPLFVPTDTQNRPLPLQPSLTRRLPLTDFHYGALGTCLEMSSPEWQVGFKDIEEAHRHYAELFHVTKNASIRWRRLDLAHPLGLFRCPWTAYRQGQGTLVSDLVGYREFYFTRPGFVVLLRPPAWWDSVEIKT